MTTKMEVSNGMARIYLFSTPCRLGGSRLGLGLTNKILCHTGPV
jgi:hypothetical protein